MTERMIRTNGVDLCTESFGDPGDPPILLIMGTGASMLWWDEAFCRRLADGGPTARDAGVTRRASRPVRRFVIRYDHRDTGRSTTFPPGSPGYSGAALDTDAVGVLDGYGLPAANLVGFSAGGGIAQLVALGHAERVSSLVLVSTSPAVAGARALPPPTEEYRRFVATAKIDWSDHESVIRYHVDYGRVLAGDRPFDEPAYRDLIRRDIARARDIAAAQNHDLVAGDDGPHRPLSAITAPTLVIHGTADPAFPFPHGQALAAEIPSARLLPLDGGGHAIDRADWDTLIPAIWTHTANAG
jgi:pimeloyl-ACP methyl ester carboxylesterase